MLFAAAPANTWRGCAAHLSNELLLTLRIVDCRAELGLGELVPIPRGEATLQRLRLPQGTGHGACTCMTCDQCIPLPAAGMSAGDLAEHRQSYDVGSPQRPHPAKVGWMLWPWQLMCTCEIKYCRSVIEQSRASLDIHFNRVQRSTRRATSRSRCQPETPRKLNRRPCSQCQSRGCVFQHAGSIRSKILCKRKTLAECGTARSQLPSPDWCGPPKGWTFVIRNSSSGVKLCPTSPTEVQCACQLQNCAKTDCKAFISCCFHRVARVRLCVSGEASSWLMNTGDLPLFVATGHTHTHSGTCS